MEVGSFPEEAADRAVRISGSEPVENYTVYIIEVTDDAHKWTVKHRYSDFHDLQEKLLSDHQGDQLHLLLPRKTLWKNSKRQVERRQVELEHYLQALLQHYARRATPKALACFLHYHLYEMNSIAASLAELLFHRGDQLLSGGEVFSLRPLQLHSVSLRLVKPSGWSSDARCDLSHILDFSCRLRCLKVQGSRGTVGSSNIQENNLTFDLSLFKSLLQIEITECCARKIQGLASLRHRLETLSVHNSTNSMMSVLVPEASEFPQWEAEGVESPVTAVIPLWGTLTTLDLSSNHITCIDLSVKVIPKVQYLDLSHNQLQSVEHLQHLYNLVHLDLSHNALRLLDSAHTRLGNIRTLNLAGNQLQRLSGLRKLYSLESLDLAHNLIDQLEEVQSVSSLPCLENLSLLHNPLSVVPDYRTRVLVQFRDRAREVCLDGVLTTQKELDTVEVLKAIQKAKDAKDKKIGEELRPPASTSSSCCSSSSCAVAPPASSSTSTSTSLHLPCLQASCLGPEVKSVSPHTVSPVDVSPPATHLSARTRNLSVCTKQVQAPPPAPPPLICLPTNNMHAHCGPENTGAADPEVASFRSSCPVVSAHFLSSNQDFVSKLARYFDSALKRQKEEEERGRKSPEPRGAAPPVEEQEQGSGSPRDGYFEMGLDQSGEEVLSGPAPPRDSALKVDSAPLGDSGQSVRKVLWCYCVEVQQRAVRQKEACLVLSDRLLGLFSPSADSSWTNQNAEQAVSPVLDKVLDPDPDLDPDQVVPGTQTEFLLPYSDLLLASSDALLPDSCLVLGTRTRPVCWFLFSDPKDLNQTRTQLTALVHHQLPVDTEATPLPSQNPPLFLKPLLSPWELEELGGALGGFPVHLLLPPSPSMAPKPLLDLLSHPGAASLFFLTRRHLWVLKADTAALADPGPGPGPGSWSSPWSKLSRVPLGSMALHPRYRSRLFQGAESHRGGGHLVQLLLGRWRLDLVFPLTQHRERFLLDLDLQSATLLGCRSIAMPTAACPSSWCCPLLAAGDNCSRSQNSSSLLENQAPPHLCSSLCPGMKLLAGLQGAALQAYFQYYIAQAEAEEVRQVLWLSVVLYTAPEAEVTSCLLLSTSALYFLLGDSAPSQSRIWDFPDHTDSDLSQCSCLSIRLSDLLSVNVGLFDQYFRVVGSRAEQVLSCVSRDSYATSCFLKELMSVLSLQRQIPAPEPSEQDFYTQFTPQGAGHSSRVGFVYPSEEEVGDLTFIVAERRSATNPAPTSFNILLYLLVFQVQMQDSAPSPGPAPCAVLQPRTLILTSSELFLLDEDYVSYPLPDFAKEPPPRERYRLLDSRRVRDVDRVLLGDQLYPQALTLVFDELPGPDLLCHMTMDHFAAGAERGGGAGSFGPLGGPQEVQWCIYVPAADSRERLVALLARQWEALCSRELPLELTG